MGGPGILLDTSNWKKSLKSDGPPHPLSKSRKSKYNTNKLLNICKKSSKKQVKTFNAFVPSHLKTIKKHHERIKFLRTC